MRTFNESLKSQKTVKSMIETKGGDKGKEQGGKKNKNAKKEGKWNVRRSNESWFWFHTNEDNHGWLHQIADCDGCIFFQLLQLSLSKWNKSRSQLPARRPLRMETRA